MSTVTEDIPLGAMLSEEQARQIFSQGEEAVAFALLQLAKQLVWQARRYFKTIRSGLAFKPAAIASYTEI